MKRMKNDLKELGVLLLFGIVTIFIFCTLSEWLK
jgi:hypothetical protein